MQNLFWSKCRWFAVVNLFIPSFKRSFDRTPNRCCRLVCNCFAILDFVGKDISSLNFPVQKLPTYVLRKYAPVPQFTRDDHEEWRFNFASKIIVNIYYNNIQKLLNDEVWKDSVIELKKRQRTKWIFSQVISSEWFFRFNAFSK